MAEDWDRAWAGRLREGWREALPRFAAGEEIATRAAGQKAMAAFAAVRPDDDRRRGRPGRVDQDACSRAPASSRASHAGRNVPFGIREHAMGAIVNGAAAHGGIVKPYGSTFLIFSDYMRGAVRLSALMGLPVVWVWTHDSVALGEDGPTHQPVEHYAALRAIPQLWVIRPADANETAHAWRVALERQDGPVALLLSRQNIPVLDRDGEGLGAASELERGGYVLWDSPAPDGAAGAPELILIATGAEVAPALMAGRRARRRGHARAGRVDALHGALRSAAAGVPRAGAAARHDAPAWRSSRARA